MHSSSRDSLAIVSIVSSLLGIVLVSIVYPNGSFSSRSDTPTWASSSFLWVEMELFSYLMAPYSYGLFNVFFQNIFPKSFLASSEGKLSLILSPKVFHILFFELDSESFTIFLIRFFFENFFLYLLSFLTCFIWIHFK